MATNPEDFDELRRKLERAHKMSIVSLESPEDSTLYGASARAIRELSQALRDARGN